MGTAARGVGGNIGIASASYTGVTASGTKTGSSAAARVSAAVVESL
jgi:hypothetical protein